MKKLRIAVAVSGGVDSICSLLLLHAAGHDLLALHGKFLDETPKTDKVGLLRDICSRLSVPLHIIDLRSQFAARISRPFANAWLKGETPNPCSICNRDIKFGPLLDHAISHGADKLATGHYVRLVSTLHGGKSVIHLRKGKDEKKDQSYFLALVPRERLERVVFPLGDMEKNDCRKYVREHIQSFPEIGESQDICFISGATIQEHLAGCWREEGLQPCASGKIMLGDKQIGTHRGLWRYTIGQRRGLGIAHSEPLYVLEKDYATNSLILGSRQILAMRHCLVDNVNLFTDPAFWPKTIWARFRHQGRLSAGQALYDGQYLDIILAEKQFPTARGQIAAIYDKAGALLAGGIVKKTEY